MKSPRCWGYPNAPWNRIGRWYEPGCAASLAQRLDGEELPESPLFSVSSLRSFSKGGAFCPSEVFRNGHADLICAKAAETLRHRLLAQQMRWPSKVAKLRCCATRLSNPNVDDVMSQRHQSKSEAGKPRDPELSDPTPEEIEQRAAEVRKRWTSGVKARRQPWADPTWRPPLIGTLEVVRQINEKQE